MSTSITLPAGVDTPAQDAAMRRAYSWARMLDYGVAVDDAWRLHRDPEGPVDWVSTTLALGEQHALEAAEARAAGLPEVAAELDRHAAACYRLCQSALEPHPDVRGRVYALQADAFARAMADSASGGRRLDVQHGARPLSNWYFQAAPGAPTVIVVGGADGWCEAFEPSVAAFRRHGLGVCLLELPGQGLSRLVHDMTLTADFWRSVSSCIDALKHEGVARVGLLGHSMGGSLAIVAAAHEPRIHATCSNGGSAFLTRGLQRYPRVLQKVADMMGTAAEATLAQVEGLDVRGCIDRLAGDLLVIHGDQDVLVTLVDVEGLPPSTSAGTVMVRRWPLGEHCVYSAAAERNRVMAGWFRERLVAQSPGPSSSISAVNAAQTTR